MLSFTLTIDPVLGNAERTVVASGRLRFKSCPRYQETKPVPEMGPAYFSKFVVSPLIYSLYCRSELRAAHV